MGVKYPNVKVKLTGTDGNAFAVMGKVGRALKQAGVAVAEVDLFYKEATSGDYYNLLATCGKWVEIR
jgi:hypothetical protein